jgi:hypothetical protein
MSGKYEDFGATQPIIPLGFTSSLRIHLVGQKQGQLPPTAVFILRHNHCISISQ